MQLLISQFRGVLHKPRISVIPDPFPPGELSGLATRDYRIVASKSYRQLFLVPAVAPHLFGSLNNRSTPRVILRCACVCEFAASYAGRSRPPFSAHVPVKYVGTRGPNRQQPYTGGVAAAILLCALKIA